MTAIRPVLIACPGGTVRLPTPGQLLLDRADGGHLVVDPPRPVWDRSELSSHELALWGELVSATGHAMLQTLPQLTDGCVNYWDAGNWALNDAAEPVGHKTAKIHRQLHLHLLGRSRAARHRDWTWGEAPRFPRFTDRLGWSKEFAPLTAGECDSVARLICERMTQRGQSV